MNDLKTDLAACVEALEKATPDCPRDRACEYPGGMDCEQCGSIFIGAENDSLCGRCYHHAEAERIGMAFLRTHAPAIAELQARCEAYNAINLGWIAHVLDWYAGNAPDSLHAASAAKQARLVRAAIDASREAGEAASG